ncbi:THO complex subunit 5 homolog [Harpegnathos saltator]|uniref:THO complex subunit 5-like protein n=1 Tax=Harpegnathos saltator TaxID=610380 RepID=E2BKD1_HARSA|nr:THO complex subunit 5 homolog [Harpegnathos saltator]EFN83855.1 THO complex subunit 5-like protein [Harpegnathos saltator]
MGKENETDGTKKRRKSVSGCGGTTVKDGDMYKTIISHEEKEAIERLPENDSESFLTTCNNIRTAMSKVAKLKSSGDSNAKDEIRELQIQTSLHFIELKKLNRMEKFRTKFARDSLVTAKSSVDSKHLHLQNLLYEVMHLKKEVIKCLQFKSKDELIELVSEEEFYKDAPENISRPKITKNNPHQLRLARLEWELTQRKQLAALCDELTESKKAVAASIDTKQTRLDNLAPQLRSILEASKPLQESLGLPLDRIRQEHQKASLLASPLYVLYAKVSAYRDAYDSTLLVKVEGDEDEAKRANSQDGLQESDSDTENQSENIVEETPVHKKRHHRLSREARQEEKRSKLMQRHPLHVKIVITFKGETKLTLHFYYLIYLKVVTVESKLDTEELGGISAGDMLISESILRELYPRDLGLESPNPANQYQLSRYNITGPLSLLGLGIPYKWAQRMAGLTFVSSNIREQKLTSQELSQDCVESVLKEIKQRVKARLDLCKEIRHLESGNLPILVSTTDPMPQKISTSLHRFMTITWKNYSNYVSSPNFCQRELLSSIDIFYEAIFRRGSSELVARIAIKPDYPKIAPIFNVSISPMVPASADIVRDIEREVNVMWTKSPTLVAQIQRLRACFDIYLETESMAPKEKIFFHPVRGRTRSRPYKYLPLGGGIFTHR